MTVPMPGTNRVSRYQRAMTRVSRRLNYKAAMVVAMVTVMIAPGIDAAMVGKWYSTAHDPDVYYCLTVHNGLSRAATVNRSGNDKSNNYEEIFSLAFPGSFTITLNQSVHVEPNYSSFRLGMLKRWLYADVFQWKFAVNRWNHSWTTWNTLATHALPATDPVSAILPLWVESDPDWSALPPIPDFTGQLEIMHVELLPVTLPSLKTVVPASYSIQSSSNINPGVKLALFDTGKNRSIEFIAIGFLVAILFVPIGCSLGATFVVPCARGSPQGRGRKPDERRREQRETPSEWAKTMRPVDRVRHACPIFP